MGGGEHFFFFSYTFHNNSQRAIPTHPNPQGTIVGKRACQSRPEHWGRGGGDPDPRPLRGGRGGRRPCIIYRTLRLLDARNKGSLGFLHECALTNVIAQRKTTARKKQSLTWAITVCNSAKKCSACLHGRRKANQYNMVGNSNPERDQIDKMLRLLHDMSMKPRWQCQHHATKGTYKQKNTIWIRKPKWHRSQTNYHRLLQSEHNALHRVINVLRKTWHASWNTFKHMYQTCVKLTNINGYLLKNKATMIVTCHLAMSKYVQNKQKQHVAL